MRSTQKHASRSGLWRINLQEWSWPSALHCLFFRFFTGKKKAWASLFFPGNMHFKLAYRASQRLKIFSDVPDSNLFKEMLQTVKKKKKKKVHLNTGIAASGVSGWNSWALSRRVSSSSGCRTPPSGSNKCLFIYPKQKNSPERKRAAYSDWFYLSEVVHMAKYFIGRLRKRERGRYNTSWLVFWLFFFIKSNKKVHFFFHTWRGSKKIFCNKEKAKTFKKNIKKIKKHRRIRYKMHK